MWNAELYIASKGVDPEAQTAKTALKDAFGLTGLERLMRHEIWLIKTSFHQKEKAKQLAVFLAEKTSVFVNPNKHVYAVSLSKTSRLNADIPALKSFQAHLYVHSPEDAKPELAMEHLKKIYKISLKGLEKGVLWSVQLREEASSPETLTALMNRLGAGFFANKHYQQYSVL